MKKKNQYKMKTKHLITMMTILCLGLIVLSLSTSFSFAPVRNVLGYVIVPFQNGINEVGNWMTDQKNGFQSMKKLSAENEKLQKQVDELQAKNTTLSQDQEELDRLRTLYNLDTDYSEFEKVAAQVIGKDTGNWYSTFLINRGSSDGIAVDMNVIADGGLVGIVTETGAHWATVRSIIDDSSNVSATVTSISQNCMVTGDLQMMDDGKIRFIQLTDKEDQVQEGDKIVTSSVSNKFLKGILIGYISEVSTDANKLTKSGTIIPAVDFNDIQEVLVIKELKQQKTEDVTSEESQTPDDSTTPTPDPTQDALSIASIVPNLLLILTVSFGFMRGKKEGMFVGFFCGLLIDIFYGSMIGFYALIYMYIGFCNGFLYKIFFDEDVKVPMVLVAGSDIAYGVLVYGLQFMLRGRLDFFSYLQHIILPEMVYTVLLTAVLYRPLYRLNRWLTENEWEGPKLP